MLISVVLPDPRHGSYFGKDIAGSTDQAKSDVSAPETFGIGESSKQRGKESRKMQETFPLSESEGLSNTV